MLLIFVLFFFRWRRLLCGEGTIPTELGVLTRLTQLNLLSNRLIG